MKKFMKIHRFKAFIGLYVFLVLNIGLTLHAQMPNTATLAIPNQDIVTVDLDAVPASVPSLAPALPAVAQAGTPKPIIINPAPSDKEEDAHIYLNFENAGLLSVLNYLGEEKKINIIPHKDLEPVKVTLTTRKPLTLDRAWNVLLTLLEMNGFSLIKVGDIYRVIPSANNGQEPLPTFSSGTGTQPEDLPDNDKVVRYVYFFTNIKVATAKGILSKMIDERNIIENADLNACIIKDQCLNIKAAMKIVKELDDGGLREAIEIIVLKWANVDTVANLFKDILGSDTAPTNIIRFAPAQQKESAYFSTTTKIIPEPVRNALILLGTKKNIDRIKEFISKYIDLPIDDAQSRLHVKELRYVQAQDMKPILDGIIKPPRGAGSEKGLVLEGGYKVFEDVIISAETNDDATTAAANASKRGGGNRLIIACNRDDWNRLEAFIDKIDKPQPQVAIEVMIIDISVAQIRQLNNQLYGFKNTQRTVNGEVVPDRTVARHIGAEFAANTFETLKIKDPSTIKYLNLAPGDQANPVHSSILTLGRPGVAGQENIWAVIQAVLDSTNAHVIDQPYVIANNNQLCSVSVSKTFRVPGQVSSSSTQNVQTQEEIPATIKAEFTPTINLTGNIDLTINLSINEFTQEPTSAGAATRTNRLLTTKASMGAGEVLVLGGLTSSGIRENLYKTPILGDIPIIGSLFFKTKEKTKTESNLYVFIRPSIIKPRFEGAPDEYTQLKLDYAKYQVMRGDMYVRDTDPIQRWFFKPENRSIKQTLSDASRGILRPIDNYTYGRNRPKSVDIKQDPYFKSSEMLEHRRDEVAQAKARHSGHSISSKQVALLSRPREPLAAEVSVPTVTA